MIWLLLTLVVLVCAACGARRETFTLQEPIADTRQAGRGYDKAVVATYCACAARCAADELCGAFTYSADRDRGLSTCTLGDRRPAPAVPSPGSMLTYVTDRCAEADVS